MGKVTGKEVGWRSLGPLGTSGVSKKTYKADGPILQITLRLWKNDSGRVRSAIPYSISFQSESHNGTVIGSSEHFGNPKEGGELPIMVRIDTSVEQLRSISALGKAFAYLTFHTNLKDYGPYGYTEDYLNDWNSQKKYTEKDRVSLEMEGEIIAGFYGYEDSGGQLSGLGVFVVPIAGLHIQDPDCAQHQVVDLQKTEIKELKTKIKELEAENEELKKRNKEMEKKVELAKSALAESSKGKVDILKAKDNAKSTSVSVTSQDHGEPLGLLAECIKTLNAMEDLGGALYTKGMKLLKDDPSWRPIFLGMSKQRMKDFILHV